MLLNNVVLSPMGRENGILFGVENKLYLNENLLFHWRVETDYNLEPLRILIEGLKKAIPGLEVKETVE